jgi:hypothetical protein
MPQPTLQPQCGSGKAGLLCPAIPAAIHAAPAGARARRRCSQCCAPGPGVACTQPGLQMALGNSSGSAAAQARASMMWLQVPRHATKRACLRGQPRHNAGQQRHVAARFRPVLQRLRHGALTQGPVGKAGVAQDDFAPSLARGAGQRIAHQLLERTRPSKRPEGSDCTSGWGPFTVIAPAPVACSQPDSHQSRSSSRASDWRRPPGHRPPACAGRPACASASRHGLRRGSSRR